MENKPKKRNPYRIFAGMMFVICGFIMLISDKENQFIPMVIGLSFCAIFIILDIKERFYNK